MSVDILTQMVPGHVDKSVAGNLVVATQRRCIVCSECGHFSDIVASHHRASKDLYTSQLCRAQLGDASATYVATTILIARFKLLWSLHDGASKDLFIRQPQCSFGLEPIDVLTLPPSSGFSTSPSSRAFSASTVSTTEGMIGVFVATMGIFGSSICVVEGLMGRALVVVIQKQMTNKTTTEVGASVRAMGVIARSGRQSCSKRMSKSALFVVVDDGYGGCDWCGCVRVG